MLAPLAALDEHALGFPRRNGTRTSSKSNRIHHVGNGLIALPGFVGRHLAHVIGDDVRRAFGRRQDRGLKGAQLLCVHHVGSAISMSHAGKFTVLLPLAVNAWLVHVVT